MYINVGKNSVNGSVDREQVKKIKNKPGISRFANLQIYSLQNSMKSEDLSRTSRLHQLGGPTQTTIYLMSKNYRFIFFIILFFSRSVTQRQFKENAIVLKPFQL